MLHRQVIVIFFNTNTFQITQVSDETGVIFSFYKNLIICSNLVCEILPLCVWQKEWKGKSGKERDKKRAREFSFDPGDEDKVSSEIVQYDEYAFESYVIREVDQEFHFRNESLAKALCALDEISRRIILKYFFMDMTDREIGEQMELNLHTVTMQRERSLKKLLRLLSEEDD